MSNPRKTASDPAGVVRIPKALDAELTALSRRTGRSKTWYARKALEAYLEDLQDIEAADAARAKGGRVYTLDEVIAELGLDRSTQR